MNVIVSRRLPACSRSVHSDASIMRRGHSARDANKKNRGANQLALPDTKPAAAARSPKLVPRVSNFLHEFSGVPITPFTILRKSAVDYSFKPRRHVSVQLSQRFGPALEDRGDAVAVCC